MADNSSPTNPSNVAPPLTDLSATASQQLAHQVRAMIVGDLTIESTETPLDPQKDGLLIVRGRLLRPSADVFPQWYAQLKRHGYTPTLRRLSEEDRDLVELHIMAGAAPQARIKVLTNILLFVLTLLSMLWAGMAYSDQIEIRSMIDIIRPSNIIQGWPFALTLMAILLTHELGHYFAARYHNVAVTLPYFIPLPLGPFVPFTPGTMGAFIQLKEPVIDRRKLFDIGIAGPLAGFLVALPLLFIGLAGSPVMTPPPAPAGTLLIEGNSLLYLLAKWITFGKLLPNPLSGEDVFINAVTAGAWFGLFVTALNLMPVGQLDGGHTVYALFGKKAGRINYAAAALMAVLGVAGLGPLQQWFPALQSVGYVGWLLWLGLIIFIIGPIHPPALDDVTELDGRRRWLGYLMIALFIVIFVPVPVRIV